MHERSQDYFGARYYSGAQGRFTSVDPENAGADIGSPQAWNGYSYALNNPGIYVDPDGRSPTLGTAAIGAAIGTAAGFFGSSVAQVVRNGGLSNFSWQEAGAASLGGFVSGGLAGLTLGASTALPAVVGVTASTNVIGGGVTRFADGDASTEVFSGKEILVDAVSGGAGGLLGKEFTTASSKVLPHLEKTLAGQAAAKGTGFSAVRSLAGQKAKVAATKARIDVVSTIVGAKTSNVVVPVARAAPDEEKEKQ